MRYAILAAVAALLGCEGPVDQELAGSWSGTTTVLFTGLDPISYEGSLRISVDGDQVKMSGFCPGGTGEVVGQGEGPGFNWTGDILCSPVPFLRCSSVFFTFTSAKGRIRPVSSPSNSFAVDIGATGFGSGCDVQRAATLGFSGWKS